MAEASKGLQYGEADKQSFKSYFLKPKKKVGRPKKRKRGRPAKKGKKPVAKQSTLQTESNTVDLTKHGSAVLGAQLEGAIEAEKRDEKQRINWDDKVHAPLRKRYADSWVNRNDLFREGESFALFCERCAINRNVLSRYMLLQKIGASETVKNQKKPVSMKKSRGRPSLLPRSIMQHICEGMFLFAVNINYHKY